jgi:uncharacterized protein YxeA
MDNLKTLLAILMIAASIFVAAFITQITLIDKDNIIVKQNDTNIFVKKYTPKATVNKSFKFFDTSMDSAIYKYPQNKILYEGILVKAEHNPDQVIIKTKKQEKRNNVTLNIIRNEDVSELFSCNQVDEFQTKIGKKMIITKTFYPRERIFYKFP